LKKSIWLEGILDKHHQDDGAQRAFKYAPVQLPLLLKLPVQMKVDER
jgi:hypothetical protein